jgi:thiol:disulfide interchange protein DsbD
VISHRNIVSAVALVAVLSGGAVRAQTPGRAARPPSPEVGVEPARVELAADRTAELTVRVTPPPGHHAYLDKGAEGALLPIQIDLSSLEQEGIAARSVAGPRGEWDGQFRATVLRGEGVFKYELRGRPSAKVADREYEIKVRTQVCNDATRACYFPETHTRRIQINVVSVPEWPVPAVAGSSETGPSASQAGAAIDKDSLSLLPEYRARGDRPERGLLAWMLLAFVAGMVLNVMPCVLPVVSITVLSFVQQAGENRRRMFALGLAFAAGTMAVFLALALTAVLFGLGWGEQFQSQTFRVIMVGAVFAFALALFGVYWIGVPRAVGGLAANNASREGIGGAFLKGALTTALATPCSGPFLGSTLAWALAQPPLTVFMAFSAMGLGMALPHVALTAHPTLLRLIPRPGPWMETFKHVTGFLLLATVVFLMISLDQNLLLFTVALLVFLAMGAWIWGRFSSRPATAVGKAAVLAIALSVVASGAYFSFGVLRGLYGHSGTAAGEAVQWEPFDPDRLQQYHREGRNVFLDFAADWCINCKFNEVRVYNSEPIRRLLQEKNVVAVKADLTREGPTTDAIRRLMERLGARSIPFLAVFPGNRPLEPYTLYDLVDRESVGEVLKSLPDAS